MDDVDDLSSGCGRRHNLFGHQKVRKSPGQTMRRGVVRFGVSHQQNGVFWSDIGTETYHICRIANYKAHNKSNNVSIKQNNLSQRTVLYFSYYYVQYNFNIDSPLKK